jgi:hypothetical protein
MYTNREQAMSIEEAEGDWGCERLYNVAEEPRTVLEKAEQSRKTLEYPWPMS